MAEKPEPKAHHKAHAHDHKPGLAFVRAGGHMVNLAFVESIELLDEGETLKLHLASGGDMTLVGADAACVMAALDACCAAE